MLRNLFFIFVIALGVMSCKPKSTTNNEYTADPATYDSITDILQSQKDNNDAMQTVDTTFNAAEGAAAMSSRQDPPQKIDNTKFAQDFYRKGIKEYEKGNYALGVEEFARVAKMKPNHKGAHYNLALGRYMLKDYENALPSFKRALEIDPADTVTVLYIGLSYYYMNDMQTAISWFDTAIQMNPVFSNAYFNRGTAKGQLKDYTGSIADLTKAVEIKPSYTDAWMNRGNAYYFSGQRDKACLDWRKAKELGSEQVDDVLEAYCK